MNSLQIACLCFGVVAIVSLFMWWNIKRIVRKQHRVINSLSVKVAKLQCDNKLLTNNELSPEEKLFKAIMFPETEPSGVSYEELKSVYDKECQSIISTEKDTTIQKAKLESLKSVFSKLIELD